MRALDLCQQETVEVAENTRRGWKPRKVSGYRYQEFAVHQWGTDLLEDWRISHLPTGLMLGRGFSEPESAAEAMVKIAKLRNDWAVFAEGDATRELGLRCREIVEEHQGQLKGGKRKAWPSLNGYTPENAQ